jgi:heme/copper-type cytochrome/quinol oxidase subunit 4
MPSIIKTTYLWWYLVGYIVLIVIMIALRVTVLWSAPANIRLFCVFLYALGAVGLVLTTYLKVAACWTICDDTILRYTHRP